MMSNLIQCLTNHSIIVHESVWPNRLDVHLDSIVRIKGFTYCNQLDNGLYRHVVKPSALIEYMGS